MIRRPVVSLLLMLAMLLPGGLAVSAAQVAPSDRASWPTADWPTSAPETQGMDPGLLAAADDRIRAEQPYITSLLVVRGGDLVYEQYYGGFTAEDTTQIWSATKSFTSTLIGFAVDEGLLSLDQTVGELIPDRIPPEADPRAATVTVRQLLTMTSGFAWSSGTDYQFAFDEVDLTARTLGLPFSCDPGTCYEYNSGNVQVASSILQTLSGQSLPGYAQPRLFDPLGIAPPAWDVSPVTGETLGAVGLHLTSRDAIKLGYLFLNDGVWDGQQLLSTAWVVEATAVHSSGVSAEGINLGSVTSGYGYWWWITETSGLPAYFALGLGSQMLYVVPSLDLVVLVTASNLIPYEVPISEQQRPKPIVEELIVPAVIGPVAEPAVAAGVNAAQAASPEATEAATEPAALPTVPPPAASPVAALAATPTGSGRVFALPGDAVFPEGIAVDEASGDFYVGSSVDGTIYRGNVQTGEVAVFLPGSENRVALGLTLDDAGRLYVAGGSTGAVAVYDTATGQRLIEVANGLAPNTFLNDITIGPAGEAIITDSFNPGLFFLPPGAVPAGPEVAAATPTVTELNYFVDFSASGFDLVQPGFNANGIVTTPDGRYLLVIQTNTGVLYRVDVVSTETVAVDLGGATLPGGDGIELEGQTLFVVNEGQITPVTLAADFASGTVGTSFSDPGFSSPTSLARYDGCLLVVNSQFDALQGQPELPFTVSSVPIPAEGAGTPAAQAGC